MELIDRQEAMESFCDMRDGVPKVYGDEMYSDKDIVNTIKSLNKVEAIPLSVIDEIKAEIQKTIEKGMIDAQYGLETALLIIDEKVKER